MKWIKHPFLDGVCAKHGDYSYVVMRNSSLRARDPFPKDWTSSFQNQVKGGSASSTITYHDTEEEAKQRCEDHAAGKLG